MNGEGIIALRVQSVAPSATMPFDVGLPPPRPSKRVVACTFTITGNSMTSRAAWGAVEQAKRVPVASTQRTIVPHQGLAARRDAKHLPLPVIVDPAAAPIQPERHVPELNHTMRRRLAMRSIL